MQLPEGGYETVAGYVIHQLGRIPDLGDAVDVDGAVLESGFRQRVSRSQ